MARISRHWILIGWMAVIIIIGTATSKRSCPDNTTAFTPVAELHNDTFNGYSGGLYPSGNRIPKNHFITGMQLADQIVACDTAGVPDPTGSVGMLILGYSTAAMTGRTFREMHQIMHPLSPLRIVIGAQGGRDINSMTNIPLRYWDSVEVSIHASGLTRHQVQMAWISTGDIQSYTLPFPDQAEIQTQKYRTLLQIIRMRFPSIKIVFLSDRPYAGYIGTGDPPGPSELAEPTAYYHSWAVKWVIGRQINGEQGYSMETLPFIDWGPVLWTNGTDADETGYSWDCRDAGKGGIHPTSKGRMKEAARAYHYFSQHPYSEKWFR